MTLLIEGKLSQAKGLCTHEPSDDRHSEWGVYITGTLTYKLLYCWFWTLLACNEAFSNTLRGWV